MRSFEISPQEAGTKNKTDERENERAALEAVINYALQCARESGISGAGDALEEARLNLSRAVFT